jgi:hypothetical protein
MTRLALPWFCERRRGQRETDMTSDLKLKIPKDAATIYDIGAHVTRLEDGAELVIRDRRPVGDAVFYEAEEVETGHGVVIAHRRVRPFTKPGRQLR